MKPEIASIRSKFHVFSRRQTDFPVQRTHLPCRRHQPPARHPQVRQREQRQHLGAILRDAESGPEPAAGGLEWMLRMYFVQHWFNLMRGFLLSDDQKD